MKKALITGATGFLGSNLVRFLTKRNVKTRILKRSSSNKNNLKEFHAEEVLGDFTDQYTFNRSLEGCDTVFHLAACASLLKRDKELRWQVNVESMRSVADVLLKRKGIRLVYCSSVGAVGFSRTPFILEESCDFNAAHLDYFLTKHRAEKIVLDAVRLGLDAVIVNPGTVIGAHGVRWLQRKAFERAVKGKFIFYTGGGTCISFVDDVVEGMFLAAEKGQSGRRYILGGHNITFKEYFSSIAALAGNKPLMIKMPSFIVPFLGSVAEFFLQKGGEDTGILAKGFGYYSSKRAEEELNYKITPLMAGLKEILSSFSHVPLKTIKVSV